MDGQRSSLDAGYIAATCFCWCGSKTSQAFVACFFELLNRMAEIFTGGNGLSTFPFACSVHICPLIGWFDFLDGLNWSVQDYKDKSRCYECGEGGHLSYECPKNVVSIFPTYICTSSCMFGGISVCTSFLMVVVSV